MELPTTEALVGPRSDPCNFLAAHADRQRSSEHRERLGNMRYNTGSSECLQEARASCDLILGLAAYDGGQQGAWE